MVNSLYLLLWEESRLHYFFSIQQLIIERKLEKQMTLKKIYLSQKCREPNLPHSDHDYQRLYHQKS